MDGIRAWSGAVCLAALGCTALQLLAPAGSLGKVFRLSVHTFFICCMVLPLLKTGATAMLDVSSLPEPVVSELVSDTVNEQLQRQVCEAVESYTASAFAERDITAKKIEVTTDISDEGCIYIQHVTITVDKQTVPIAKVVGEVLEKQWEATVEVIAE